MIFSSGGLVKELTTGITIKGAIMAIEEAMGEFAGPKIKNSDVARIRPVRIPAHTAIRVTFFQKRP